MTKWSRVPLLNILAWVAVLTVVSVGDAGLVTRLAAWVTIVFGLACGALLLGRGPCGE